jgi:hypothetical protein
MRRYRPIRNEICISGIEMEGALGAIVRLGKDLLVKLSKSLRHTVRWDFLLF